MPFCEQFIYTAGKTRLEKGYQVTAKSSGISNDLILECSNYLYPLGMNLNQFKQSRSLILLTKNKVAFSIIKNIGVGFDGRPATIYSHTFIINKEEFQKLANDSRVFEEHYLEDPSVQGILPRITLGSKENPPAFNTINEIMPILPDVLTGLFKGDKIAIFKTERVDLIQNILSLVPPSLRLISFSTFVNHPNRQPKYDFILTQKHRLPNLDKGFLKIDPQETKILRKRKAKNSFEKSIQYLLNLIQSKKDKQLVKIYENFEKIRGGNFKSKIILVTTYTQFKSTTDEKLKQQFADNIFEIIKKLDKKTAAEYLEKIKNYSKYYAVLENKIQPVINPNTSFIDALVLLPLKVTADLINSFVEYQKNFRRKFYDFDDE